MRSLTRLMLRDPELRKFGLLFVLAGIAASAAMPLIPLYLTKELDASLTQVSAITVGALVGAVVGLPLGRLSDRLRSRSIMLCVLACWMAVAWLIMPLMPNFWAAACVYAFGLPFMGPINAQIFAGLSHALDRRGDPNPATITSTLRGGYSFGYVLGPLAGTGVAAVAGLTLAFVLAAAAYLLLAVLGLSARIENQHVQQGEVQQQRRGFSGLMPLAIFTIGVCLVIMGDMFRVIYLPIYVVDVLSYSTLTFGVLIATAAALEILIFPLVGAAADRFGVRRVIISSLVLAVMGYSILASSSQLWQVWIFHILHVLVFAVTISLGVTYAQWLTPGQAGLASAAFFSAQTAAVPLAGATGAVVVGTLGLPGLFWVPAGVCLLCLVVFIFSPMKDRGRVAVGASSDPVKVD